MAGIGSDEPRIRVARVADLDALARMWEKLENYHADLGGPEYHLVSGWKGNWRRFTRSHIGHKDRFCLVAELDGTAVGFLLGAILVRPRVRAPIVRTHLRLVCRSGPTESGSRGIARE